jgi:hypothetical protein
MVYKSSWFSIRRGGIWIIDKKKVSPDDQEKL